MITDFRQLSRPRIDLVKWNSFFAFCNLGGHKERQDEQLLFVSLQGRRKKVGTKEGVDGDKKFQWEVSATAIKNRPSVLCSHSQKVPVLRVARLTLVF